MSHDDWLSALREACAASTQAALARRLGVSATMVNQALKGTYKGDLSRLKALVEADLLAHTVDCPAIGEMPKKNCLEHQARQRPFATVNAYYAKLYRACRSGCPYSKLPKEY